MMRFFCTPIARLAALLAAATACAQAASPSPGQAFPERPIRMIVPLPPGTASDFLARTLSIPLSEAYKHQVVVDNRPGAGGLIGSGLVAKATPDGYTLAMIAPPHIVATLLQTKPPYHPLQDFVAVIQVASIPNVLVVAPGMPAKNVQELVALLKSRPGHYNFASVGVGTLAHMAAEIFNRAAGVKSVHVPFKIVADAYSETLADRVHYFLFTVPTASPLLRDGKLRPLAVTGAKRSSALPDLPTVAEAGLPDAQSDGWFGILAPAGTPGKIVAQLRADVVKILNEPRTRDAFARQGAEPVVDSTPDAFTNLMKSEYARFQTLIEEVGIKPQ